MADILIRGFKMPTDASLWLLIRPDGTAHKLKFGGKHGESQQGVAVPLPERHGRLGDLDKINASLGAMMEIEDNQNDAPYSWAHAYTEMQSILDDAPTIVPAEGGGEE